MQRCGLQERNQNHKREHIVINFQVNVKVKLSL
jgi:hypothetical protein